MIPFCLKTSRVTTMSGPTSRPRSFLRATASVFSFQPVEEHLDTLGRSAAPCSAPRSPRRSPRADGRLRLAQRPVEVVHDRDHPRLERDSLPLQPVRVPRPVEPLVVRADDLSHAPQALDRVEARLPQRRVPLHQVPLLRPELLLQLSQHRVRHRQLPDVVKERRDLRVQHRLGRHPQVLHHRLGHRRYPLRVAPQRPRPASPRASTASAATVVVPLQILRQWSSSPARSDLPLERVFSLSRWFASRTRAAAVVLLDPNRPGSSRRPPNRAQIVPAFTT